MCWSKYLLILLLFFTSKGFPQTTNYIFDHLSTANVLSSNKTEAIIQDKEGFYWIATADGLNMFDGTHCKIFRNDKNDSTSLSNNQCTSLAEDLDGNIWVGTNKGFCRYNKKNGHFNRFYLTNGRDNLDPLNRINSLCRDKEGNIWIGSFRLSVYNHKTNSVTVIPAAFTSETDYKKNPYALKIKYDAINNAIWYHSSNEVRYFSMDEKKIYYSGYNPVNCTFLQYNKNSLFTIDSNKLWYYKVGEFSLQSLDLTTWKESYETQIKLPFAKALHTDAAHNVWIASWNPTCLLYSPSRKTIDSTFFKYHHDKSALSANVTGIYLDKTGNYWFCSTEGVSIFNPQKQLYKYAILDEKQHMVGGVSTPEAKTIFVTAAGGLIEYEPTTGKSKDFTIRGIDKIKTLTILKDTLVAAGNNYLVFYNLKKHTIIKKLSFIGTSQFVIKDHRNNIWIGTWGKGLYKYDYKTLLHFDANAPGFKVLLKNSLVCATTGGGDNLWIGYNGGGGFAKYNYSTDKFTNYKITLPPHLQNNVSNTVTALEEDGLGNLWIGTYGGGLYYFDSKTNSYSIYLQSDGLLSSFINKLIIANRYLWISTSNGINYMQLPSGKIEKLNAGFIFPSDDVVNSGFKTTDGLLCFFCVNKILRIDPAAFFLPQNHSRIVISTFKIFEREVYLEKNVSPIILNYNQNSFSFDFSVLKTNPSAEIKYAYKLYGLSDWIYTTNPSANYTNVSPGKYTLLIKAANEQGDWMDATSVNMIITPPFWRTWWFYLLIGSMVFLIVFSAFRYRINQLKKIIGLRSKISQDLHDEVGSALSGIALYSYLTKQQIQNNETAQVNDSLEIIQNTATGMVTKLSDIVWAINPSNDSLYELLQHLEEYAVEMATVKNITFSMSGVDDVKDIKLPMDHRKNIYLIFKEALNNSIKYSNCSIIHLQISKAHQNLNVKLADNGKGFNSETQKRGNGINNMQQRAKDMNAKFSIQSSPEGTFVQVSF